MNHFEAVGRLEMSGDIDDLVGGVAIEGSSEIVVDVRGIEGAIECEWRREMAEEFAASCDTDESAVFEFVLDVSLPNRHSVGPT